MKTRSVLFAIAATLLSAQAVGQDSAEAARSAEMRAAQAEAEQARETAEVRRVEVRAAQAEAREQMLEAERQLVEASRRIAELSSQNLAGVGETRRTYVEMLGKPRIGVTIGGSDEEGPVEGVTVSGVTPGSAAEEAGLRAGDIITSVNDEALSAKSAPEANRRLLDFMGGVEEGDKLDIEYLRNGNVGKVEVEPRVIEGQTFAWVGNGRNFSMPVAPDVHVLPDVVREFKYVMPRFGNLWGDMELVELNAGLGRYFGTDSGLLVVSAPKSDSFKLQDGDVIESIDGREPTSVGHAMRILGSYQPGEELELRIMRDKRRQTVKIEMPDDRTSFVVPDAPPPASPSPAAVPQPAPQPVGVDTQT